MRRALYVAAFDSQLKWCARIRDELQLRGFSTEVVRPDSRSALSEQQIADAGFVEVPVLSREELLDRMVAADAVVCSLQGPATQALLFALAERLGDGDQTGPVVVTGWVGIIIEKITAGYLARCGSDVVAVNSVSDADHFRHAAHHLQIPDANLLLAGLPFLSASPSPASGTEVKRLLFADQPTVPDRAEEREYLYAGAIAYARAHPDREVLLKPRHRPDEDTFHKMRFHPEVLLGGAELPPNFRVDYTPIATMLPSVDLLVTVSSTACLEALDHGCRVALVLDLGVHERYGNHVFLESGLLRTWDQISADDLGTPEPDWLASYFFPRTQTSTEAIADRVEELLASGERPSAGVWASAYFRSAMALDRSRPPRELRPAGRGRRLRPRDFVPPVLHRPVRSGLRELRSVATRLRLRRSGSEPSYRSLFS
ncbi:DUF6716 putative glycosyltransferase [uncultured Friedmanniella sp.]|uniref:DUF6716 putative glycosyltransferase n=1 Tax=uncultured Friedmanniella sp. TaxID=335381 RepID=UPI0035CC02F0